MATSETEMHEETNVLNCPICYLKLKDPKQLTCRCVFCSLCIKKHFRSPTQEHAKCPACNTPSANPPELKDVSRLLETLLKTNQAERCTCESPGCKQAVRVPYICVKCQLWLCQICQNSVCPGVIKDVPTKPVHEGCASKHVAPELHRILVTNKHKACSVHERKLVSYCEKCHECVCEMCRYNNHPHHDLVDIEKKADVYLNMLLGQSKSLGKKIQEHENALLIYRKMVDFPSTPQIISKEQCRLEIQRCLQKADKCDGLVKSITQLNMFGSNEAILNIGWDMQKNIEEELNLFPLNDLKVTAEWWHGIENMLNASDTTEQNTEIQGCVTSQPKTAVEEKMDDQQQTAKSGISGTVPNDSGKESSPHKSRDDETSSAFTKEETNEVMRIQTRAGASKTIPNNDHKEMTARSSVTLKTITYKEVRQTAGVSGNIPHNDNRERAANAVKVQSSTVTKHNKSKVRDSTNIPDEDQKTKSTKSRTGKMKGKSSVTVKRTIQTKSCPLMEWTIQTRSCTSKTNTGDGLGEQGGSKAKRARTMSHGEKNCSAGGTDCTAKTRKGSKGTFQSVSMTSVRQASFTLSNSVDEATAVIAQVIGQDQINLDIVDNGRVVEGSELVGDIQRPLQLVVHNSNRQVSVIHQTLSPDIVNDWEEGPRVEMSCGHAITPDNLYGYCWSQLTKQRSSFRCFADVNGRNCDKEWLFVEVAEKACLSHDEHFLFESRINRNWINNSEGVRECPSCRLVCERQDPTNAYVNCLHCKSAGKGEFRFCWYCLDGWTVKHQCKKSSVHQMLSHCERKEIADISGCPSIRACPECNTLIEHTEGCKHMTCVDCCCTFCFVCLGFRGNTGFACGSYDSKCDVAPIQTVT